MNNDHILLDTNIIYSELIKNTNAFFVYIQLALRSVPNESNELIASVSLRKFSNEIRLSYQSVRTAINHLISDYYISKINEDNQGSVFIIRGFVKNG